MLKKMGIDSIGSAMNWVMTLANTVGGDSVKEMKQKMPGFLGLSLEDERLFVNLRAQLEDEEDLHLTHFLSACKDYERNRFRNVVTGIPDYDDKEEVGTGKDKKVKTTKKNRGVDFLKQIAIITKDYGPEEAYRRCLSGGVIIEDPIQQKALRAWGKSVKWFEKKLLSVFNVRELSNINLSKKAVKIEKSINAAIEERNEKHKNRTVWEKIFW